MTQTFYEFLMEYVARHDPHTDDLLPEIYEKWICEADIELIIGLAERWHREQSKNIRQEAAEEFEKVITEKLKIAEDELARCNKSNGTSFSEDGGEALVGQTNAYEELLNYLKEK